MQLGSPPSTSTILQPGWSYVSCCNMTAVYYTVIPQYEAHVKSQPENLNGKISSFTEGHLETVPNDTPINKSTRGKIYITFLIASAVGFFLVPQCFPQLYVEGRQVYCVPPKVHDHLLCLCGVSPTWGIFTDANDQQFEKHTHQSSSS